MSKNKRLDEVTFFIDDGETEGLIVSVGERDRTVITSVNNNAVKSQISTKTWTEAVIKAMLSSPRGKYDYNLRDANLAEADLSSTILANADLTKAYLVDVNLNSADLKAANLNKANLKNANLTSAKLTSANLRHTNLQGANLRGALMNKPPLFGADFTNAKLKSADLIAKDLPKQLYLVQTYPARGWKELKQSVRG